MLKQNYVGLGYHIYQEEDVSRLNLLEFMDSLYTGKSAPHKRTAYTLPQMAKIERGALLLQNRWILRKCKLSNLLHRLHDENVFSPPQLQEHHQDYLHGQTASRPSVPELNFNFDFDNAIFAGEFVDMETVLSARSVLPSFLLPFFLFLR
jgi:hypothetical protein